jgi:CcmD family protein
MSWQIALSMSIGIVWAGIFVYLLWLQARIGKLQSELQRLSQDRPSRLPTE